MALEIKSLLHVFVGEDTPRPLAMICLQYILRLRPIGAYHNNLPGGRAIALASTGPGRGNASPWPPTTPWPFLCRLSMESSGRPPKRRARNAPRCEPKLFATWPRWPMAEICTVAPLADVATGTGHSNCGSRAGLRSTAPGLATKAWYFKASWCVCAHDVASMRCTFCPSIANCFRSQRKTLAATPAQAWPADQRFSVL